MGFQVNMGALCQCSFGSAPCSLIVLPTNRVMACNMPAANIMDYAPIVNLPSFATCMSLANPAVASATSAAMGVLTPMPCVPVTTAPWITGSVTALLSNMPTLNDSSSLICTWGGVISITYAGQVTVMVS